MGVGYCFDTFGNITLRQVTIGGSTVGQAPAQELFTARPYNNGVDPVPDNQIHATGFLYDGNGNMVSDGIRDYLYDELNQEIEVHQTTTTCTISLANANPNRYKLHLHGSAPIPPSLGASCYGAGPIIENAATYAADGLRAFRQQRLKQTDFVRIGGNVVKEFVTDYDSNAGYFHDSHEKAYIYGPNGLLATETSCAFNCGADEVLNGTATRYYELDHLGTTRAVTNEIAGIDSTFDYEPFGLEMTASSTGNSLWTDFSSNSHRFTGHEREFGSDGIAFQDYMRAREYSVSDARFNQQDPVFSGAEGASNWNVYQYGNGNPVHFIDPLGQDPLDSLCEAEDDAYTCQIKNSSTPGMYAATGEACSKSCQDDTFKVFEAYTQISDRCNTILGLFNGLSFDDVHIQPYGPSIRGIDLEDPTIDWCAVSSTNAVTSLISDMFRACGAGKDYYHSCPTAEYIEPAK